MALTTRFLLMGKFEQAQEKSKKKIKRKKQC
jgi:hypothetical protein